MGKIKTVLEATKWKIIPFSLTDRKPVISTIDTVFYEKFKPKCSTLYLF